jgi:hypothetical protein
MRLHFPAERSIFGSHSFREPYYTNAMSNPTSVPTIKVENNGLVITLPDNMDLEAALNVPIPADVLAGRHAAEAAQHCGGET